MGEELMSIGNEGDRETFLGLRKVGIGSSIGGESTGLGGTRGTVTAPDIEGSVGFDAAGSSGTAATGSSAVEASAAAPGTASDSVEDFSAGSPHDWICTSFGGGIADVAALIPVSSIGRSGNAGG
jgi:hypothetical protein